ncbi:MAG: O-antigen polymerase [Bacteroidota bacterium]
MSWICIVGFGICSAIILSCFKRGADPLSPARVFGFIWSLSITLVEFKLSALQHIWNIDSWILLLLGVVSFLIGTFIAYVMNFKREMVPINSMRRLLRREEIRESRLFWIITLSVLIYSISYLVIFLVKGFLPVFAVGAISRVDFYVFGFGVLINSTAFIIYFTVLYYFLVHGKKGKKVFLTFISLIAVGSYFLLLQRFQIIMAAVICFTLLYYASHYIRWRTTLLFFSILGGVFFWIMTLRLGKLVLTYNYYWSRMKFSADYALLTEPYMYVVMNLENFARAVSRLEHHTYGYFTFDFITALSGLKYWVIDYFKLNRTPFLNSSYNTYTAFYWFYSDFGVFGLALIPLVLGFSAGLLYYRMRSKPTIKNVTAYGVMVFVMFISYFNFPIAFLWFEYNILALFLILRWTMIPLKEHA